MSFEVVKRETEMAIFTCDMCGAKCEGPICSEGLENHPSETWSHLEINNFPFKKDLCPSCAERVLDFVGENEKYGDEVKRLKDQNEELKAQCRKFLDKQSEFIHVLRDRLNALKQKVEGIEGKHAFTLCGYVSEDKNLKKMNINEDPTSYSEACANLKPFDRVLVREMEGLEWEGDFVRKKVDFGQDEGVFCLRRGHNDYCLPFEGYEHLLGKRDNPFEE